MPELRAAWVPRDAVTVTGPDAVTYLQGQLSQDVAVLEVGGSAWSWLLQPAGKVDALVRVTRTGPEALLVDVDSGHGDAVLNRLTRFKLRTRADLALTAVDTLAVRGPGATVAAAELAATATPPEAVAVQDAAAVPAPAFEQSALAIRALWPDGEEAADVLCHGGFDEAVAGALAVQRMDGGAWEAERIVAGVPVMGAELTEKTIPAETGLVPITASFTKGCYTGQELVARIDSRGGNVPRHLRALRSAEALRPGDELTDDTGKVVGTVTSAAVHPTLGPVALGYVGRAVDPAADGGATVTAGTPGAGAVPVSVLALGGDGA